MDNKPLLFIFFMCTFHVEPLTCQPPTLPPLPPPVVQCTFCTDSCRFGSFQSTCRCDRDCEVYKDCCPSVTSACTEGENSTTQLQPFECHSISVDVGFPPQYFWMVSECPEERMGRANALEIQTACTGSGNSLPPVSDMSTGLVYRNEYCAVCNSVEGFAMWSYELQCQSDLRALIENNSNYMLTQSDIIEHCVVLRYLQPQFNLTTTGLPAPRPRTCHPSIDTCLEKSELEAITGTLWNDTVYEELKNECLGLKFQNHLIDLGPNGSNEMPYRNQQCAVCNGVNELYLDCFRPMDPFIVGLPGADQPFNIKLDINGDGQFVASSEVVTGTVTIMCSESEVFDPVSMICRQIISQEVFNTTTSGQNCSGSLVSLTQSDSFSLITDSNTVLYEGVIYTVEFNTSEGNPVICVNFTSSNGTQVVNTTILFYTYPDAYFILTYSGCSISVIGCILILVTYTIFKELRTLPSKILMNLAFAILVSNLLIILAGPLVATFPDVTKLCVSVAILLHFFFLSQFSWMSVMSIEMTRTFYQAYRLESNDTKHRKYTLLLAYLCIGWGSPVFIALITIIVNFTTDDLVLYGVLPDGSSGSCWINHLESSAVVFIAPLALAMIFNAITFTTVMVFLWKLLRSQIKLEKRKKTPFIRVIMAIFSVSGLTWLFGFLAILAGGDWAWYPFIIFNSLQGFIIFVTFLCTKRILMLYISAFMCKKMRHRVFTKKCGSTNTENLHVERQSVSPINDHSPVNK